MKVRPKLIVFDLDACFWNTEMKFFRECPFVQNEKVVGIETFSGKHGEDLLSSPRYKTIKLFCGAKLALHYSIEDPSLKDTKFACASKTTKGEFSQFCLNNIIFQEKPLREYFDSLHIYPKCKAVHFSKLKEEFNVQWNDILMFDDCLWHDNIADVFEVSGGRVTCVHCPEGLTEEKWAAGLREFETTRDESFPCK